MPEQRHDARFFLVAELFVQELRETVDLDELIGFGAGLVHEFGCLFGRQSEVHLDEFHDPVELAFFEHVVCPRDVHHQNGRGQTQRGLAILRGGGLRPGDGLHNLGEESLDHYFPL